MVRMKSLSMMVAATALLAALPTGDFAGIGSSAAGAQEQQQKPKQKTRKVPAMSLDVHKRIQKAQEAMDEKNFPEAKVRLAELLESTRINDYERAVAWQLNAMIAYEQEDTPGTIRAYEEILSYAESIPEALELQIIFGLSQLYYSTEKYDLSLEYVKRWESRTEIVGVNQLIFIAQLYYTLNDYRNALSYAYKAISDAEAVDTVEVKESWYQIALSSHWELGEFANVRDILEILIINWPKPVYWTQLAGVYGELKEEQKSYSITEAAYKQGFLDDRPVQVVNMAQILMARQAPIKAAWVLERGFKEELIEDNVDNKKLLGQAYLVSAEYAKSVGPLTEAANGEEDGDLWMQVGQVNMQLDRLDDAEAAFANAEKQFREDDKKTKAKKNRSRIFNALMQRSGALIELKKYSEAERVLNTANRMADSSRERGSVRGWRDYLRAEKAREDMLAGR